MIVITGGTGTVGSALIEQLNAANVDYRLIARNPDKVKVGPKGTVVKADLTDKVSVIHATKGADKLFVLTNSFPGSVELQQSVIELALQSGVQHVVRLSVAGADVASPMSIMQWHAKTDAWLQTQKVAWTVLRPGGFMQNTRASAATIKKDGAFYGNQGEGKAYLIDARDIAAAAFKVLTTPGHEKKTYPLFGSQALSLADVATKLSTYLGKTVKYVNLTDEQFKGGLVGAGLPEWLASDYVTMGKLVAQGGMPQDKTLETLIGKPRTYEDFLAAFGAAFK